VTTAVARRFVAGASVLAAFGLSVDATRLSLADEIVIDANAILEGAWRRAPPDFDAWLGVRNDLVRAERLAPRNPAVLESLGVIHARRAADPAFLTYARDYFLRSRELRPTSPYTWANYAEAKYLLGETGPDFERALLGAARLGPWEPEVQRLVADLGLAMYKDFGPAARREITVTVASGMRRNPAEMLSIAERRGRLDLACPHLAADTVVTEARWKAACHKGKTT
jgi:hypothetical protein